MLKNYLPNKFHYSFWFLFILFFFVLNSFSLLFISILVYSLFFYLFRKHEYDFNSHQYQQDIVKSPVNGRVIGIKKDIQRSDISEPVIEITIINYYSKELGLFLPIDGEVVQIVTKADWTLKRDIKKSIQNYKFSKQFIHIENEKNDIMYMELIHLLPFLMPIIWINAGDSGKKTAAFGYAPFGTIVNIYLPQTAEILVRKGDSVSVKNNIIAKLRN